MRWETREAKRRSKGGPKYMSEVDRKRAMDEMARVTGRLAELREAEDLGLVKPVPPPKALEDRLYVFNGAELMRFLKDDVDLYALKNLHRTSIDILEERSEKALCSALDKLDKDTNVPDMETLQSLVLCRPEEEIPYMLKVLYMRGFEEAINLIKGTYSEVPLVVLESPSEEPPSYSLKHHAEKLAKYAEGYGGSPSTTSDFSKVVDKVLIKMREDL